MCVKKADSNGLTEPSNEYKAKKDFEPAESFEKPESTYFYYCIFDRHYSKYYFNLWDIGKL